MFKEAFVGLCLLVIVGVIFSGILSYQSNIALSTYDKEFPITREQTLSKINNNTTTYEKIQIINRNCGKMTFGQLDCREDLKTEIFYNNIKNE